MEEPFCRLSKDANNWSVDKRSNWMAAEGATYVMAITFPLRGFCSLERMMPIFKPQNQFFLPDAKSGRLQGMVPFL